MGKGKGKEKKRKEKNRDGRQANRAKKVRGKATLPFRNFLRGVDQKKSQDDLGSFPLFFALSSYFTSACGRRIITAVIPLTSTWPRDCPYCRPKLDGENDGDDVLQYNYNKPSRIDEQT